MHKSQATLLTHMGWFAMGAVFSACQTSASGGDRSVANPLTSTDITLQAAQESPDMATGSITFIGNATVLIRYAGFSILTDPTFIHKHERAAAVGFGLALTFSWGSFRSGRRTGAE
jgi:hypothetical protein